MPQGFVPPQVPDHELLRRIGVGAYGEVWLARNATGSFRAVKVVHRASFDSERPYQREFEGIRQFEPVSHARENQVDSLEYQVFDLCVLRGSPPNTVATKLGVKLWKVYLAQRKVAGVMMREAKRIEAQA